MAIKISSSLADSDVLEPSIRSLRGVQSTQVEKKPEGTFALGDVIRIIVEQHVTLLDALVLFGKGIAIVSPLVGTAGGILTILTKIHDIRDRTISDENDPEVRAARKKTILNEAEKTELELQILKLDAERLAKEKVMMERMGRIIEHVARVEFKEPVRSIFTDHFLSSVDQIDDYTIDLTGETPLDSLLELGELSTEAVKSIAELRKSKE